jgi:integrase
MSPGIALRGQEKSKSFPRAIDAERYLIGQESRKQRGEWIDPRRGQESLEGFWSRWVESAREGGRPAERTLVGYEAAVHRVGPRRPAPKCHHEGRRPRIGRQGGRASPWRAHDVLKVVRMLLNRAMDEDLIGRNPAARVLLPAIEQEEPWVLTPEELERLADEVPDRWRAFVLLAAYSSLRWSELVALRVERLDLLRNRIWVEEKITEHGHLIAGEPRLASLVGRFPARASSPGISRSTCGSTRPARRGWYSRLPKAVRSGVLPSAGSSGDQRRSGRGSKASRSRTSDTPRRAWRSPPGANPLLVAARLGHTSTRMVERH